MPALSPHFQHHNSLPASTLLRAHTLLSPHPKDIPYKTAQLPRNTLVGGQSQSLTHLHHRLHPACFLQQPLILQTQKASKCLQENARWQLCPRDPAVYRKAEETQAGIREHRTVRSRALFAAVRAKINHF